MDHPMVFMAVFVVSLHGPPGGPVCGTKQNNVVLHGHAPASHNFSPFLDTKLGVPASERFKAVGGLHGLLAFASKDGIHWRELREKPVVTQGAFDSQNVVFWSEAEGVYVCYFRTSSQGIRSVSRATSPDFLSWSEPVAMHYGDAPPEHLYTNHLRGRLPSGNRRLGHPMPGRNRPRRTGRSWRR
ncbi:MAG: hypothetical protein GXY83_24710 [Rhodopirellula sp.]|nr:hypothetical protein [Rhodopirellula sp.]